MITIGGYWDGQPAPACGPRCKYCGIDVDLPRDTAMHFVVYCSDECAAAGKRIREEKQLTKK